MNNTGSGRLVSSFNLGGTGARPGTGAYHIYGNHSSQVKQVSQSTYNAFNTAYTTARTTSRTTTSKKR
jgi:hypothetical protein